MNADRLNLHICMCSICNVNIRCLPPSKEKKNKGRGGTEIQIRRAFNNDLFPALQHKPLKNISRTDLLSIQQKIEARGALSIAEKVRSWLNEIFRYAVATGELETNPAADLDIAGLPYRRNKHYPYIKMRDMPELMAKIPHYKGSRQTVLGLRLLLLTGVRTGELRFSEFWRFELEPGKEIWRIPAEDVKQLQKVKNQLDENVPDYIVPLSRQAVAVVKELISYSMPGQRYVLAHRSLPREAISENTLNGALKRMGFKNRLSPHGVRATISTALNEKRYDKDFVEAQLSHAGDNKVRAIYNHAEYVEHCRHMMQDWACLSKQLLY
ncbi:Prophage integrase IntS [Saezia sanguinis]|uniref:Prophage integrase IntS n=1 Tax=Saezia sanguinis TaxID=1965230 RepID=A0A433SF68_9BURK|nr:tyrosine-type recombinase/integrase [Saezia sanguinis]RUS67387.1 Prophage integrase IntS [Saezia sanguinis]